MSRRVTSPTSSYPPPTVPEYPVGLVDDDVALEVFVGAACPALSPGDQGRVERLSERPLVTAGESPSQDSSCSLMMAVSLWTPLFVPFCMSSLLRALFQVVFKARAGPPRARERRPYRSGQTGTGVGVGMGRLQCRARMGAARQGGVGNGAMDGGGVGLKKGECKERGECEGGGEELGIGQGWPPTGQLVPPSQAGAGTGSFPRQGKQARPRLLRPEAG